MQQPIPGFLTPRELEEVARLFEARVPPLEIDEHCHALLAQRAAVTDWEMATRESRKGQESCFIVGRYRAASRIVDGGTYYVMLAQHLFLGRADVLKTIRATAAPDSFTSALRRWRAQASVQSANMVAILDAGFLGTTRFAAVERVVGRDLRAAVRRNGRLSTEAAAPIVAQVAMGLHDIHSVGYAFGDLRPDKILVPDCSNERTKLCDAGIGDLSAGTVLDMVEHRAALDYVAPEIIAGHPPTTVSDVYSLGCVMYYAVTSKVPFPGGSTASKQQQHLYRYPLDPRRLNQAIDGAFAGLLASMMAKGPNERIQSMVEVVARLEPWIQKTH